MPYRALAQDSLPMRSYPGIQDRGCPSVSPSRLFWAGNGERFAPPIFPGIWVIGHVGAAGSGRVLRSGAFISSPSVPMSQITGVVSHDLVRAVVRCEALIPLPEPYSHFRGYGPLATIRQRPRWFAIEDWESQSNQSPS